MGRRHIQAAESVGLTVSGICDVSKESLSLAEREQGVGPDRHFTDFETMLARTRPDCLVVATTAPTHAQYTSVAATAGVQFILCEKPMGTSLDQCDQMIDLCR